jgi:D-3-phosphoglycerate dehydrogenase
VHREAVCLNMPDPAEALVRDLLEWIGPTTRPYREVIEAWRTSCPRLPVWEEACERGFIEHHHLPGAVPLVSVSALGTQFLAQRRRANNEPNRREQP